VQVRALSEELENPMNVHRWRKLEGSDPATFELVQKIHVLQKRLIEKSEEVSTAHRLVPSGGWLAMSRISSTTRFSSHQYYTNGR